jgi:methanethiol S-methyltransferase
MLQTNNLILLGLLWLSYFLIHSLLASLWLKQWVANRYPGLTPWHRIIFNALAGLLFLPLLAQLWWSSSEPLWSWQGSMAWLAYTLMLLACLGFVWSLRYYDGSEFLGFRQLQKHQQEVYDQEQLHISPMHRFVRHPWYSLGLVLVWTQDMDPARLLSALLITLYLIVGSRLEENKLITFHGDIYLAYQKRVPSLIPNPWRFLSQQQAQQLQQHHDY